MSLNILLLCSKLKNGLWKIVTKSQVVTKFNVTKSRLHCSILLHTFANILPCLYTKVYNKRIWKFYRSSLLSILQKNQTGNRKKNDITKIYWICFITLLLWAEKEGVTNIILEISKVQNKKQKWVCKNKKK